MAEEKKIIYALDELNTVVDYLQAQFDRCAVFTFTGSLGTGKTTLIRALLRRCGVTGVIASPTFTIVQMYRGAHGDTLYHFDCYRLKSLSEFRDAGFDEYLYEPGSWCFIEWPEVIMPLLHHRVCHVSLSYQGSAQREACITIL